MGKEDARAIALIQCILKNILNRTNDNLNETVEGFFEEENKKAVKEIEAEFIIFEN